MLRSHKPASDAIMSHMNPDCKVIPCIEGQNLLDELLEKSGPVYNDLVEVICELSKPQYIENEAEAEIRELRYERKLEQLTNYWCYEYDVGDAQVALKERLDELLSIPLKRDLGKSGIVKQQSVRRKIFKDEKKRRELERVCQTLAVSLKLEKLMRRLN